MNKYKIWKKKKKPNKLNKKCLISFKEIQWRKKVSRLTGSLTLRVIFIYFLSLSFPIGCFCFRCSKPKSYWSELVCVVNNNKKTAQRLWSARPSCYKQFVLNSVVRIWSVEKLEMPPWVPNWGRPTIGRSWGVQKKVVAGECLPWKVETRLWWLRHTLELLQT